MIITLASMKFHGWGLTHSWLGTQSIESESSMQTARRPTKPLGPTIHSFIFHFFIFFRAFLVSFAATEVPPINS